MEKTEKSQTITTKHKSQNKVILGCLGCLGAFILFTIIVGAFSTSTTKNTPAQTQPAQQKTSKEAPAEKFEINVTSQIVKKIDGKYRYFFDVRNNDTKPFTGVVIIRPKTKEGTNLGPTPFETTKPIAPSLGESVYTDLNTGPVAIHGNYGCSAFDYEVKVNGKIVKQGGGQITDKFEDLTLY